MTTPKLLPVSRSTAPLAKGLVCAGIIPETISEVLSLTPESLRDLAAGRIFPDIVPCSEIDALCCLTNWQKQQSSH